MRWVFFCGRPLLPDSDDPFAAGLGGTEQAIIHLTQALADAGHDVAVAGGTPAARRIGTVDWVMRDVAPAADVAVAINDASLLPGSGVPVVWFHNEVGFLRESRKRRLPALFRHRPAAVFIGSEQARLASRLLPFRARAVIPYGLPPRILAAEPAGAPPPPVALFTSQAYRGLREIIDAWRIQVQPALPAARLAAHIAAGDVARFRALAADCPGIAIGGRIGNDAMLAALRGARVLLAPGHVSETFCMAAAEAIAMGVPVVTLGIGSLKERVRDGVDGFICRDYASLAERCRATLTDDSLWRRMHEAGLATRHGNDWRHAATAWEDFVKDLCAA